MTSDPILTSKSAPTPVAPLILAFVGDLMFTTRIETVIRHLGYEVKWIERAADLGEIEPGKPVETPGEALHGREGRLFQKVTEWQPALLLFDLTNQAIPWQKWIPLLKASPATRRIPILCFGPHQDVELMQKAKSMGAEAVLARSRFVADMPALFQRYARVPNADAVQETCQEPLSELAIEGIRLFNEGQYYACHDSLEAAWMADEGPGRDLYRGILQVAIAYYQIEHANYRGAAKMLLRVRQWLEPLPTVCRGVDVAQLRTDANQVYEALTSLGPDRIGELDRQLFRPVHLRP